MILFEEYRDLFSVPEEYAFAHCISADYKMGAGIALEFQKRFNLKDQLILTGGGVYPTCIKVGRILNLVIKSVYWKKPTYQDLLIALEEMKAVCISNGITKIAMPRIGAGLDRLMWNTVKANLLEVFYDTDIEFMICYL